MKYACIGGDRRQIEIAEFLKTKGHQTTLFALPKTTNLEYADSLYDSITSTDAIILPLPTSRDGWSLNVPLTSDIIYLQDILLLKPKFIFGGMIDDKFKNQLELANIKYYDYFTSNKLTVRNAVLTAEAAVGIAINCSDLSIYGSKSLVIGFGRIGRQLARYLKTLGSSVTATSRNDETLALIEAECLSAIDTANCTNYLSCYDFIFNTVPFPLLNRDFFKKVKNTALVLDLATKAGTDFKAAEELSVKAINCSGLPGKYSPVTAATFIAEEIVKTNFNNPL